MLGTGIIAPAATGPDAVNDSRRASVNLVCKATNKTHASGTAPNAAEAAIIIALRNTKVR